jgi:hypothetical protein
MSLLIDSQSLIWYVRSHLRAGCGIMVAPEGRG